MKSRETTLETPPGGSGHGLLGSVLAVTTCAVWVAFNARILWSFVDPEASTSPEANLLRGIGFYGLAAGVLVLVLGAAIRHKRPRGSRGLLIAGLVLTSGPTLMSLVDDRTGWMNKPVYRDDTTSAVHGGIRCPFRVDPVEWSQSSPSSEESGATPRQRQADGLLKCKTLRRMSRAEVRELLGHPDNGFIRSPHWEYVTGPHRGVPIDTELLTVTYGDNGLVRYVSLDSD